VPDFPTNVCWIDNNNELSGELAAKHLFDIDKTKIAYLAGSKNDLISETRKKVVEKEMAEHYYRLIPEYTIFTDSTYDESYEAKRKLMSAENKPNAIICANNTINLACINSLTDLGYKIPEDVAVITFNDYPYATITKPPTTVINIDVYDLGKQAAYFLVEKIKKPNYQFQTYVTVPLLMIRESTQIDK
jgi:DNA-binding LacI/PurR family transcriptional regulator